MPVFRQALHMPTYALQTMTRPPTLSCWQCLQASHGGSASLEHLTSLFVERSHELWRVPDAQVRVIYGVDSSVD